MKKLLKMILPVLIPSLLLAQVEPATLGLDDTKTNEAQQNAGPLNSTKDSTLAKLTVFLQGPFDKGKMSTELNKNGFIPLAQPYNQPPWNYFGNEVVSEIPAVNIVDWVLVDVRSAASPGGATGSTIIARKAGFLIDDGSIVDPDGSSLLSFDTVFS